MKIIKIKAAGHTKDGRELIKEFCFTIVQNATTAYLISTAVKIAKEKTNCNEVTLQRIEISTDGKMHSAID